MQEKKTGEHLVNYGKNGNLCSDLLVLQGRKCVRFSERENSSKNSGHSQERFGCNLI